MESSVLCTSCNAVIFSPTKGRSRDRSAAVEPTNYLTGPVELNTLRRYMLQNVPKVDVEEVLQGFQNRKVPLCSFCMEMITRIYDFENEIDRIKSLIDSMVSCLKNKVLATVTEGASDTSCVFKLRALMAGKGGKEEPPVLKVEDAAILKQVQTTFQKIQYGIDLESAGLDVKPLQKQAIQKSVNLSQDTRKSTRTKVPAIKSDFVTDNFSDDEDEQGTPSRVETDHKGSLRDSSIEVVEALNDEEFLEGLLEADDDDDDFDEDDSEDIGISDEDEDEEDDEGKPTKKRAQRHNGSSSKSRKTDRRNRKVNKIGPDQYEFFGYKYSKTEDGNYKCEFCSHVLKTRDSALHHVKRVHMGEGIGSFLCSICGKSFKRRMCYTAHQVIHSDIRRHQCDICGRAFKQQGNLIAHKQIHTGELNFACEVEGCGKRFLRKKQLVSHTMRHTGERPHMCELCGKSFVSGGELNIHLRRNHGGPQNRRYNCDLCTKNFFTRYHLNRHKKNVHKVNSDNTSMVITSENKESVVVVLTTKEESDGDIKDLKGPSATFTHIITPTTSAAHSSAEFAQFLSPGTYLDFGPV